MLRDKMLAVIDEVNDEVAERAELIECIAIALLTKKNLFILGDTGQAKSFAINEFRKRIDGAKQFERLLSKQTDEEALFGRIDLKSLIDGNPKMITKGKIPDSHLCYLDELFKANEGVLNSLLTALNERRYTNESETVDIPVISFMSASNEIPNFNGSAEKILKPLYDRFELKVVTHYIESRAKRLNMLSRKQNTIIVQHKASITLDELYVMQKETDSVAIPNQINELMDDVLCELRRLGIHVSDRKYLNYYPIAQAKAWLNGRDTVLSTDLMILKNYLWTAVEEMSVIQQVLERFCVNPLQGKLCEIEMLAQESYDEFTATTGINSTKVLIKLRGELIRLYGMLTQMSDDIQYTDSKDSVDIAVNNLEALSKEAHDKVGFTYASLYELEKLQ